MYTSHFIFPIVAYILGSIPFGLVLSKLFRKNNLRTQGSKNIGATNVWRTQGKALGIATFVLDFLKGTISCYVLFGQDEMLNLAILASPVIGHIFSIWLKFKGGKGIATYFGILCAIDIHAFLATIIIWIIVFVLFKISSIAGLTSVIFSIFAFALCKMHAHCEFINQLYVLVFLVILIVLKHTENIKRLLKNEELNT